MNIQSISSTQNNHTQTLIIILSCTHLYQLRITSVSDHHHHHHFTPPPPVYHHQHHPTSDHHAHHLSLPLHTPQLKPHALLQYQHPLFHLLRYMTSWVSQVRPLGARSRLLTERWREFHTQMWKILLAKSLSGSMTRILRCLILINARIMIGGWWWCNGLDLFRVLDMLCPRLMVTLVGTGKPTSVGNANFKKCGNAKSALTCDKVRALLAFLR